MTTRERDVRAVAATLLAGTYIALMALAVPALPMNMRVADVLFPALAIAVLWRRPGLGVFNRLTLLDWCVLGVVVAPLPSLLATADLGVSAVALTKRAYVAAVFAIFALYFQEFGVRPLLILLVRVTVGIGAACLMAAALYAVTGMAHPALGFPMTMPYFGFVLRVSGGMGTSAMLGNHLTLVWPLACVFAAESARRGWWAAALAVIVLTLALSLSHALAGFAAATLVLAWPLFRARRWRVARMAAAGAVVLLIVAINLLLLVTVRDVRWTRDHNGDIQPAAHTYAFQPREGADRVTIAVSYVPMNYFALKKIAFAAFMEHPLTGIGIGTFHRLTERAYADGILSHYAIYFDPHSTIFGALAETGVLGALAVVALFAACLTHTTRQVEPAWMARALKAAVIGIAVNSLNVDALNFRFLWIAVAALRVVA